VVKDKNEIHKDTIGPFRDKGYYIDNCQAFAISSRREQKMVAMTKEDM